MHADPVDKANILHNQTREDEGDILCLDGQPYPSMSGNQGRVGKTSDED